MYMFCRGLMYVVFTRNKQLCTLAVHDASDITLDNLNELQFCSDTHAVNLELDRLHTVSTNNAPNPIEDGYYSVHFQHLVDHM